MRSPGDFRFARYRGATPLDARPGMTDRGDQGRQLGRDTIAILPLSLTRLIAPAQAPRSRPPSHSAPTPGPRRSSLSSGSDGPGDRSTPSIPASRAASGSPDDAPGP